MSLPTDPGHPPLPPQVRQETHTQNPSQPDDKAASRPQPLPEARPADPPASPPSSTGTAALSRLAIWSALAMALVGGTIVLAIGLGGRGILETPSRLVAGWLALAGGCVGGWLLLTTTPREAIRLPVRLSKRIILLASLACAVPMLWLAPVLSTEPLRYRYDGQAWLLGTSPYTVAPAGGQTATGGGNGRPGPTPWTWWCAATPSRA